MKTSHICCSPPAPNSCPPTPNTKIIGIANNVIANPNAIITPNQIKLYTRNAGILRKQAFKLTLMAATGLTSSNMTKAGVNQNIIEPMLMTISIIMNTSDSPIGNISRAERFPFVSNMIGITATNARSSIATILISIRTRNEPIFLVEKPANKLPKLKFAPFAV